MEAVSLRKTVIYALLALLVPLLLVRLPQQREEPPRPNESKGPVTEPSSPARPSSVSRRPWTLAEARAALQRQPHDMYLQYVVLQLARQQGRLAEIAGDLPRDNERGASLFHLFGSAGAIQADLQRRLMRADAAEPHAPRTVPLNDLAAPAMPVHKWGELPGKKRPTVSVLARAVPDDFYLVEFKSLRRLTDALDAEALWSAFIGTQAFQNGTDRRTRRRTQRQLALGPIAALEPYVAGAAITGSDLFLADGSDVTLVLHVRELAAASFPSQVDYDLTAAQKARPDAVRATGKFLGIDLLSLTTTDRLVSVHAATFRPTAGTTLHVRSNSPVALRRVIEAALAKTERGEPARRLGESDEYRYVRTLLPQDANEEDGLIYLSEPFLRRLIGPRVQLTEARRLLAATHLRMIGHAAQLYRTQVGKAPRSLDDLTRTPAPFYEGPLASPFGGSYVLSKDGTQGVCPAVGTLQFLKPCCELPLTDVSADEAAAYRAFAAEQGPMLRRRFNPVAVRVQVQDRRLRAEALVPPMPDEPNYVTLTHHLGGPAEALDPLPVPPRVLASATLRLNKEPLLRELLATATPSEPSHAGCGAALLAASAPLPFPAAIPWQAVGRSAKEPKLPARNAWTELQAAGLEAPRVKAFLERGIGNQVGVHLYDNATTFDLNLASWLAGASDAPLADHGINLFAAALFTPGYIAVPVKDRAVVDDFLAHLDAVLARQASAWRDRILGTEVQAEFYHLASGGDQKVRALSLRYGPARLRCYWARIGDGLYLANQASVLDDLSTAYHARLRAPSADHGPVGHAMVRLRGGHWSLGLPGAKLGWEENHRAACQANLAKLSAAARGLSFTSPVHDRAFCPEDRERLVLEYAAKLYGTHCTCPDGGTYRLAADGMSFSCTEHGSLDQPRQKAVPSVNSAAGHLFLDRLGNLALRDVTATLTVAPEGLRVVFVVERK